MISAICVRCTTFPGVSATVFPTRKASVPTGRSPGVARRAACATEGECQVLRGGNAGLPCELELLAGRCGEMHGPVQIGACKSAGRQSAGDMRDAGAKGAIEVARRRGGRDVLLWLQ